MHLSTLVSENYSYALLAISSERHYDSGLYFIYYESLVTEHNRNFPDFYITTPQPCPYLANKEERKLFTHLSEDKPSILVDNLLRGGFRRSQNIAYMPYCDNCSACVSVRVLVNKFNLKQSFKRIKKANTDLHRTYCAAIANIEQYTLFRNYIEDRHSDGGMADMSYGDYSAMVEGSVVETFITEYRLPSPDKNDQLIAVALCDKLNDGISLVYSFFDTSFKSRSLGTYIILDHIEYAQSQGMNYVYLGYWITGSKKMDYKTRFKPQEHLTSQGWQLY